MPLSPLITGERIATALGKTYSTLSATEQQRYTDAAAEASAAVRAFVDRDFEVNNAADPATTRTFEYDGSGMLEINDAVEVTGISVAVPFAQTFTPEQWEARPFNGPVYDYISLPSGIGLVSREMGFTRNLDRYEGPLRAEPTRVQVTARWGWPSVPANVQRAAVWTAINFIENPRPYISESIEGYSRTIGPAPTEAIPERAQALLMPFLRFTMV